uniref:Nuclear RNA export factor 1-like n=3 Tax=Hirondellea gigas TaxID=1518452 RepID=A0A2P2I1B3_9CRUS
MGGDQRSMALNSKNDRGRNVYHVDNAGSSKMYGAVQGGRGGTAPPNKGRGHPSDSTHWRGQTRLTEGHWRGPRGNSRGARGGGNYSRNYIGRRPPPPRYDDLMQPDNKQDKTKNRQEMYGRGRGFSSKLKIDRRPTVQNVNFSGWQKIMIHDSAQHEPAAVMEEVKSMVGEKFEYHMLATESNNITFFLEDNECVCKSLRDLSKRLAMPGSNQRHTITVTSINSPPFPPPTEENLEKVKLIMSARYSSHMKRLDLSMFHKDIRFRSVNLLFPLYVPSNLGSVGRLITANIPNVEEIDLSKNKLSKLDAIADHLKTYANLTRLNLSSNKIPTISTLYKLKGLPILELSLEGNSLCNRFKNIDTYISEVRNYFPKLQVLDGKELPKPIGFEVDDDDDVIPPFRPSYFCNQQAKEIVLLFLKQYYQVFDSNDRRSLAAAYCEDALFSVSALLPENGPRAVQIDNISLPNRNLKVTSQADDRVELLFRGRTIVMEQISMLPPTTHDLDSFVVDVPIAKPQLMKVVLNGIYRRENISNKSANIRSFQRSLIIVPVGSGYCIANEQLHISLATYDQMKLAFKSVSTSSSAGASTAAPSTAAAPSPAASNAGGLETVQLRMIEEFAIKSNMKPDYAKLCLEQNAWDFNKAAELFMKLKEEGKIPAEYYKQ